MDKGTTLHVGKMVNSQNIYENKIENQKIEVNNKVEKKRDNDYDLEAINRKLEDIDSELSEHKDFLEEFVKKTLTLESELKEGNPVKEKIKRRLEKLSLISFQISGTANSLFQVFSGLK